MRFKLARHLSSEYIRSPIPWIKIQLTKYVIFSCHWKISYHTNCDKEYIQEKWYANDLIGFKNGIKCFARKNWKRVKLKMGSSFLCVHHFSTEKICNSNLSPICRREWLSTRSPTWINSNCNCIQCHDSTSFHKKTKSSDTERRIDEDIQTIVSYIVQKVVGNSLYQRLTTAEVYKIIFRV